MIPRRISSGNSIFDGKLKALLAQDDPKVTQSSEDVFCSCKSGVENCSSTIASFSSMDHFDYGMTNSIQPKVPGSSKTCTFRRDDNYFSNDYKFYSGGYANNTVLSWPTATGITEAQAEQHCLSYLWDNSPLKPLCPGLKDINPFIEKCKNEIQV